MVVKHLLEALDLSFLLEVIQASADTIHYQDAISVIEDYKPLDVQSATMALTLCRGIRQQYPDWRYLIDGDGGDENLKDYPIEENPELKQQLQQDPEGAQIKVNAMIAKRIAEITTELVQRSIVGQQKDPLVQLKQQELDLKSMDMQRKAAEKMADIGMKEDQFEEKIDIEKMKVENDEDASKARIRVADEKLQMTRDIAEQKLQVEKMKRTAEDRRTKAIRKKK